MVSNRFRVKDLGFKGSRACCCCCCFVFRLWGLVVQGFKVLGSVHGLRWF